MSDEKPRPEPILQPMRVVQVPDLPPVSSAIPSVTPNNPTGKKLVMGKKEIEAATRAKKPKAPTPFVYKSDQEVQASNLARIDDLDRNTKTGVVENQLPEYDWDWINSIEGKHVSIAWLQTPISISGFVSSETTMSPQKIRGLSMVWNGEDLLFKIENTNGVFKGFIPGANVKLGRLE